MAGDFYVVYVNYPRCILTESLPLVIMDNKSIHSRLNYTPSPQRLGK